MKRVVRPAEAEQLTVYRTSQPTSTWDQMRADGQGRTAYEAIRVQLIAGQGGLCAFCELDIRDQDPLKCRVEHFHPKSDRSTAHNWALDWQNMLGVCMGGSQRYQQPPHALEPLPANLSCDAHKDQMITVNRLEEHCEGWIINPAELPAYPRLFFLEMSTGRFRPDEEGCGLVILPGNRYTTTIELVQNTIDMLNLNCDRLCQARLRVVWDVERNKKKLREQGVNPQQGLRNLAERYLRQRWPGFFTSIRFCLGTAAEQYLTDIGFQG
jgi:uncharacterized protein (TIGR02646 family)